MNKNKSGKWEGAGGEGQEKMTKLAVLVVAPRHNAVVCQSQNAHLPASGVRDERVNRCWRRACSKHTCNM